MYILEKPNSETMTALSVDQAVKQERSFATVCVCVCVSSSVVFNSLQSHGL